MRGKAKKQQKPNQNALPTKASGGYLYFAVIGVIAGLVLSISIKLSVTASVILIFSSVLGMVLLNRALLYFGFGPNSGGTAAPAPDVSDYLTAVDGDYSGNHSADDGCD